MEPTAAGYREAQRLVRQYRIESVRRSYAVYRLRVDGVDDARLQLFKQGRMLPGVPSPEQEARLAAIRDLAVLQTLDERLLDVASWDELLGPE